MTFKITIFGSTAVKGLKMFLECEIENNFFFFIIYLQTKEIKIDFFVYNRPIKTCAF